MSADRRRTGGEGSLEGIREASDQIEKSPPQIVVEKVVDRWQTAGSIVVLAVTSYLLFYVDGGISLDGVIFSVLTVALLVYFLVTLWTDVRME